VALSAHAQQATEIYRCLDADGRLHYTNSKKDTGGMKRCELVTRQINVAPSKAATRSPSDFPRESKSEKISAKDRQREILQSELSAEEAALAKARQDLAQQEAVRDGNERNYARVQERLKPYQDSVEAHQKNIEALKREIANQYR
jgi:septal ring factor EnvC (AmiA/AmiB activator)